VLGRYILDHPETVTGRRVMDLGTGSGIVAIAAAKCATGSFIGVDIDPIAVIAAELNAEANGVIMSAICDNILDEPPPDVDLLLVGDLFYDVHLASKVLPFLKRCRDTGIDVLIGDPGRDPLPRSDLKLLREYSVADFGDARESRGRVSGVYTLQAHW
jgi:predicted nicotinamide N-methyase